jgi:hypothetical protein
MPPFAKSRAGKRLVSWRLAASLILAGFSGASAQAAILESTNITSHYQISFGSNGGGLTEFASGSDGAIALEDVYAAGPTAGRSSVVYDGLSNGNGGFSYLHNVICSGYCSAFVETTVVSVITNSGQDAISDLRFDTVITPGHLGFQGLNAGSQSSFNYDIGRVDQSGTTLAHYYSASGALGPATDSFGTTGTQALTATAYGSEFADLTKYVGDNQMAYDWGATNVSISLGALAAGDSMTIVIKSITSASTAALCADLDACDQVQAVFGDPRNDGGILARGTGSGGGPVIISDRKFGIYDTYSRTVDGDETPPPDEPEHFAPVSYARAPQFIESAVPEPATWAMLVGGFALVGGALRKSPKRRAIA